MAAQAADTTLSEALLTLRKRRWVLIAALILGILYGLYRGFSQPKVYDAYGRIQVRTGSSDQYRLTAVSGIGGADTQTKMMTEVAILQSDTLLLTVARALDLANNPAFLGAEQTPAHRDLNDSGVRQDTLRRMQISLTVGLQPRTDIIRISYSSLSGKLSADIVNELIVAYMNRSFQTRSDAAKRVSGWLSKQLDDLKQTVETEQSQVLDRGRRLGILGFDPTHNQISASLDDLSKASGQAKLARIVAESRYRMLAGMDPNAIEGSIDAPPGVAATGLNSLRGQLATARANYAELEANLGPKHPQSLAAKAQIDELGREVDAEQNRLLLQAKENFLIAQANEEKTDAALESQKTEASRLRDDLVDYTLRERELESNRTLYEGLLQKLRNADVQAGLESTEIDIVDQAVPPASPTLKPKSTLLLTTVVFALILGMLIAFLLDALDTSLRGVSEIEVVTGLPSLAVIPSVRRSAPDPLAPLSTAMSHLAVLSQPKSQFTESFRALRTAILLSNPGREPAMIMFTSATPSEGKTTTSTNFASILAQRGSRVLLIDADLRRPAIHHRFGLSGKLGLSTLLTGASTLAESVQSVPELPSLDILVSGPIPPFPTELISSDSMKALLEYASHIYTHIVVDSPPILSVTDGVLLSSLMDAVVLVIRHGKSSKQVVRRARDLLVRSNAPIKGFVLNAVDSTSSEYAEYYGYASYGYGSAGSSDWDANRADPGERSGRENGR